MRSFGVAGRILSQRTYIDPSGQLLNHHMITSVGQSFVPFEGN